MKAGEAKTFIDLLTSMKTFSLEGFFILPDAPLVIFAVVGFPTNDQMNSLNKLYSPNLRVELPMPKLQ